MARPLRVLMTADPIGGVWTYACELIGALAEQHVEVVLATMGAALTAAQRRAVHQLSNVVLAESGYALEWMPEPWHDVDAAADWLRGLEARHAPDVVHVNGFAHAAAGFRAPVLCVAHSCVVTWIRGVRGVRGAEPGPAWAEYRARVARGLRAAGAVVAPTRAILDAILEAHGVTRAGRVIPNGRAAAPLPPGGLAAGPEKEPFVLAAGRLWDEAKGLDVLDACAPSVPWPIRVAGPLAGPGGAEGRAVHAQLLGPLEPAALAAWMARAAIYALPARYEPFGLAALEAALAGCALVLGELPTLREVWGDSAVYVRPGDPDALARALAALSRDPLRRAALAASACARALALTPQRMAAAYRGVYDELRAGARREAHA
ncbi:MAG TPA: glycosyltransferase [Kofleriaceae bacterium]|nr:glycosyltransferase [Kofleriaceae bacterium]